MSIVQSIQELDFGVYQDARAAAGHEKSYINLSNHLEQMAAKGGISEELYRDPATLPLNSQGRKPSAVEQLLAHSGIRLGGLNASSAAVFFKGSERYVKGAEVLFPAFAQETFERAFLGQHSIGFTTRQATEGDSVYTLEFSGQVRDQRTQFQAIQLQLADLVSFQTGIDGDGYRVAKINADQTGERLRYSRVAERAELPVYVIELSKQTIFVYKYGGRVNTSYEALRRMRIDKLALLLQRMAYEEQQRLLDEALEVGLNGDGNANAALDTAGPAAYTAQKLDEWALDVAYNDQLSFNMAAANLVETKAVSALRYPGADEVLTPDMVAMYANQGRALPDGTPLKLAPKTSLLAGLDVILAWDRARALEQVVENGSQIEETQRFITNQTQDWTMSINTGFAKPFDNAFQKLTRA